MDCKANGCNQEAEFITHWHPRKLGQKSSVPKWGVCWYHRMARPNEWTKTTERISQYRSAVDITNGIRQLTDARLKPIPQETATHYFERLQKTLDRVICGEPKSIPDQAANFGNIIQLLNT